jgi:hypothetical protein
MRPHGTNVSRRGEYRRARYRLSNPFSTRVSSNDTTLQYSFHATAVRHYLAALDNVNLLCHVPVSWTTSSLSNQPKTCQAQPTLLDHSHRFFPCAVTSERVTVPTLRARAGVEDEVCHPHECLPAVVQWQSRLPYIVNNVPVVRCRIERLQGWLNGRCVRCKWATLQRHFPRNRLASVTQAQPTSSPR